MKHATSIPLIALACAAALGVTQVSAQESTSAASAGALDKFVGSGTCTGKTLGHDMKAFHDTTGKYSGEKVLEGNWVVIHYDEDQSAAVPKPFHVVQYFGYDKAKKRYASVLVDNSGSSYATGTSDGWKGDSISFDESLDGQPVAFRDSFTSSNGMATHTGMMRDKHGKWIKTDEEHCK
ncbi:MAG TPA: DUF1579 family protein, partial [Rhodanobacteraceae bacterium]|nr:DUF1579 family protein [Rhodanobacteraceae bacterium]